MMTMNSKGMTLLEVLVALVILSIAALAIMKTSAGQIRGLSHFQQLTVAGWVAENQLTQLYLQHTWPAERWTTGESKMLGQTWYWRWRGVATSDPSLRAIMVEVRYTPQQANPLVALNSYVTKP
jgi:general secretion pathway protein I